MPKSKATTKTTAELSARLEMALANVRTTIEDVTGAPRHLADAVEAAGFYSAVGTVAFAGQNASGQHQVQFNEPGHGYSSTWPQWAFELAKSALLADKKVWVASNGDPFGSNLVFVMIMPERA